MIIIKKIWVFSAIPLAFTLVSCTQWSAFTSQSVASSTPSKYPESAMIYNVCHERWLRNGYSNYTFNLEQGTYSAKREVQRGTFTQSVVVNHRIKQAATCEVNYHNRGASCDPDTRRKLRSGKTIHDFFVAWKKNPGLYQSCHPVLGYPTGYGHTFGTEERRIDANEWLIISSVIPISSGNLSKYNKRTDTADNNSSRSNLAGYGEQKIASAARVRPEVNIEDYASVTDLEFKVISSVVKKGKSYNSLVSKFDVINKTNAPALVAIKGWLLDKNYKRYPLSVTGKPVKKVGDSEITTLKVDAHTQMAVNYEADGVAKISLNKQTAAMLEIMSIDGVKINLTLPGQ